MLKNLRSLDYVVLLCEDMDEMQRFYRGVLGLPIHRNLEGWVELEIGSVLLTLRPRGRPYDGPAIRGSAGVQLAFRVEPEEVNSCYAELVEQQVEILDPPRSWNYGHRTLFFRDPEGNVLEIYADI